ncbi:MAG: ABC-F family ATP-binding cassette domain-containing protein [Myxococcota bacterium]
MRVGAIVRRVTVATARELHKRFGERAVLNGVDLSIDDGERLGLVGINGSGKSTLAKIVAGIEPPDEGSLAMRRGATVAYLSQTPDLDPTLDARGAASAGLSQWRAATQRHAEASARLERGDGDVEALLADQAAAAQEIERHGGWDLAHEIDAVLGHVGIGDPTVVVGTLSGGERRRVALARLLVSKPSLAIMDEPTNHLDVSTIEWLERYLVERFAGALLLVTHDRWLLDRVVTRTLELDHGKLFFYAGGYGDYLEAKAERSAHAQRAESNRRNILRKELEWLRRQPKARTGKSKARIGRIEDLVSQDGPNVDKRAELRGSATRSGKTILELHDIEMDLGGRRLIDPLTMSMSLGTRLGIVGDNGTGKTTLLRIMMGELAPTEGHVVIGKNTEFAYLDQARSRLDDDKTVHENVSEGRARITIGKHELDIRSYLERLLFDSSQQAQRVASLSGGERARVALAKILSHPANVVVLDEPTNDLDVATLGALEELLMEWNGTCLIVTHDRWFMDRVATAVLAFESDARVVRYEGNWSTYVTLRGQVATEASEPAATSKAATAAPTPTPAPAKKLTYAERLELEAIEPKIEAADAEVSALEAKLADPETYSGDPERARAVGKALDEARQRSEALTDRWAELEAKRT